MIFWEIPVGTVHYVECTLPLPVFAHVSIEMYDFWIFDPTIIGLIVSLDYGSDCGSNQSRKSLICRINVGIVSRGWLKGWWLILRASAISVSGIPRWWS